MAKIQIVVGSVMGTSLGVAKSVSMVLEGFGHTVELYEIFRKRHFDPEAILLVCTSSTGMGDLPDSIVPFYSFLVQDNPNIAGMRYGLISLGDSSYPNFAEAGKLIDETLSDLGATRCGDPLVMDAIYEEDHEETAALWIEAWHQLI